SLGPKLKIAVIILVTLGALGIVSYQVEGIRERWEYAIREGDTSGRDKIFEMAWGMVEERPLLGWGPVQHLYELGSRVGMDVRDPHNLCLWLLTEGGLVGTLPFFLGVGLCLQAAWKALNGSEGALPLALLISLLVGGMSGTDFLRKFFWVVHA